jgi:hypothetical protein
VATSLGTWSSVPEMAALWTLPGTLPARLSG